MGEIVVELAADTDVGRVRTSNEDAYLVGDLDAGRRGLVPEVVRHTAGDKGSLFVVCDGMGGAAAGEVASYLAVEAMYQEMVAAPAARGDLPVFARLLRRAVRAANLRLFEEGRRNPYRRGMGTTLSGAALCGDSLVLAQVGDSRAYLLRGGALVQITRDQSVVSALVHAGRLSPTEARTFGASNVILQALGVAEDVEVSLSVVALRAGDILLLCSDGLHGPVNDDDIREALLTSSSLEVVAGELVRRALVAGGPDNVTVVVARFTGAGLEAPRSEDELPRFVEFDPAEEGERSFTTTSRIVHRLAARAGLGEDPGPPPLPATGQHPALSRDDLARHAARSLGAGPTAASRAARDYVDVLGPAAVYSPATDAVRQRSRVGIAVWILALLLICVGLALVFGVQVP